MTLPINYKLPELNKADSSEEITSFLQDLTFELQNMYEQTAQNVNGVIRNNHDVDGSAWIPVIKPSGVNGTITYTEQSGWVHRAGLITNVWFHINWTSIGTSTGTLRVDLPYKVTKTGASSVNTFMGTAATSAVTFVGAQTALVCVAEPDTYLLRIVGYGSAIGSTNITLGASGIVGGHISYIGVENE